MVIKLVSNVPTSTRKVEGAATRMLHCLEGKRRSSGCWSVMAPTLTRKVNATHQSEAARRSSSCWSEMAPTSTHMVEGKLK